MSEKKDQKKWTEWVIKFVLSCVAAFPVYAFFYLTFPASMFAFYLITAGLIMAFAPWDDLKKKFLS
ncbi:MAG: hypothetical protein WHS38_10270 [Thermodesulforhabdaceae bacterium]